MENHSLLNSPPRRRATYGRRLLKLSCDGPMSACSFDFPLPPSKNEQTDQKPFSNRPDFSRFSWNHPRLRPPTTVLVGPVSPRTVPSQRLVDTALSEPKPSV
ncbi:hypothetical protein C8A03DRAFT_17827 [Achaetomium macrosporum]|uniref:Uncharacterized protein n=1 Tax=Achaetomium macrosporum TaxID=79813 RepID=A0AAN7H548_9PEZI|nr:hypothetical protein C8A03DRAFT_17827 [Achaetomium macrosporum]